MHIMIELACKVCLHMNVHELVYASQFGLPANAMLVCWAEHFCSRCEGLLSQMNYPASRQEPEVEGR